MATWAELQERVRRDYVLDVDQPGEFAMTVERREGETVRAHVFCVAFLMRGATR